MLEKLGKIKKNAVLKAFDGSKQFESKRKIFTKMG